MIIATIRTAATVEITSGTISSAFVEDAAGRRPVPGDVGKFHYFVTVIEPDGTRICMWSGEDYGDARAEAIELGADFDGRIVDLTGRAA